MASKVARPQAIIFDFDGTLTDSMSLHIKSWIALLQDNDLDLTPEQYWASGIGGKPEHAVQHFLGEHLTFEQAGALADQKEFLYRYLAKEELKVITGADTFLHRLKAAGYPLAIATSAGRKNAYFQLRILGLEGLFNTVVTAEHIHNGKPAPDIFLLAAKILAAKPEDCLAFEDSHPGITSAHAAGMPVIAVASSHGHDELGLLPGVEFVIEDFNDPRLDARLGLS